MLKYTVKFYSEVMDGTYHGTSQMKRKETTIGQMCIDVLAKMGRNSRNCTFVNVRRNQESNWPFLKVKNP
jgi:hypothetical protein